jgi:copper transport protein
LVQESDGAALSLGVLFVLTFLTGSARAEAGSEVPVVDGGVIMVGVLLVIVLAVSFVTTAKVSRKLGEPKGTRAAEKPVVPVR